MLEFSNSETALTIVPIASLETRSGWNICFQFNPEKVEEMTKKPNDNRDSTRDRILLEAGPIFASKGFRGTTIREICDNAKVNLASINYYFGDKQQLYNETVVMAREMRVKQVPQPTWDAATPPEEKLGDFVRLILKRLVAMQSEPWQVRLLMREILQPTEACRHLVQEYFRPFFETLCGVVDEIVGERLPDHKRHQIGFSIIGQCLYYRFSADVTAMIINELEHARHFDRDGLAEHITEFSLGAIERMKQKIFADPLNAESRIPDPSGTANE